MVTVRSGARHNGPLIGRSGSAGVGLKVIGAGFGRTGTLSLKFALEKLGFDACYHMMEVRKHPQHPALWTAAHNGEPTDWEALFTGYQASVDWPSCNLWREQLAAFPDARVILSLRDPQRWYESVMNTIYKSTRTGLTSDDPQRRASAEWANELIWQRLFDGRMDDAEHVKGVFERHNQAVIDELPADRLLVFEASQGWAPLCEFLGVPVPDEDYPRVNTTEDFQQLWQRMDADSQPGKGDS